MINVKKIVSIGVIATIGSTFAILYTNAVTGFFNTSYVSGYQVPGASSGAAQNDELLNVVQRTVNRVLGILSLVALILALRGGFQMLTAGSDDAKVKSGTKVLKNAGIGLAVIGLARLIVSFIYRIIGKVTT